MDGAGGRWEGFRDVRWEGIRVREYRASALGYSLERLVAPHLGYEGLPTPDFLQTAFDEGNRLEPIIIEKLRATLPCRIEYVDADGDVEDGKKGEEVRLEIIPNQAVIVGHIDGRITISSNGGEKVLEIKSMSDKTWQAWYRFGWDAKDKLIQNYKWQISAYMLATGLPCMLVGWNKATEEIARQTVTVPFYGIADIAKKIAAAEKHITAGTIPSGCEDFPCPYVFLHAAKEEPEPAEDELNLLLELWLAEDRDVKMHEKARGRLKDQITELVGEIEGKVKGSQGVTVSRYWQKPEERVVKYTGKWVTKIEGPRVRKGGDGD